MDLNGYGIAHPPAWCRCIPDYPKGHRQWPTRGTFPDIYAPGGHTGAGRRPWTWTVTG